MYGLKNLLRYLGQFSVEHRIVIIQIFLEERFIDDFIAKVEVFAEQFLRIFDIEFLFFSILQLPYVVFL